MKRISACVGIIAVAMSVAAMAQQGAAQGRGRAGAAAPAQSPETGPKAVASVREIMTTMVMPSSDVVFGAGAEEPKTDADWEKLRLNAIELAESANLLMIGSRVRDRGDWMTMARAQLDAAEAVVRLAVAKKADGLADASDKAYETCTSCHDKYWADRNTPR